MDYDFQKSFARIEEELLRSMMRNMQRHKAWEDKEGFNWSMWQAEQLKALNVYKQRNQKQFSRKFNTINAHIQEVIEKARVDGNLNQEAEILEALKKGYKPPPKRSKSVKTQAAFFRLNDRKIDALIKATISDVQQAERAVLRMANDKYRKVIFDAQAYANSGAGTYEKAVDMATRDFLSSGLNCVEYSNGARHTLKDYADMAIRTASKRAYLTGEGEKRKEWGISTVIVNKRGNPCPKCLPFVGKVFIDDVWSGGKQSDGPYPLLSSAIAAGLYHPRCKDSHTTYFPGISSNPNDHFSKIEVEEIEEQYSADQRRLLAKRNFERYDRMSENSLDSGNTTAYREKANYWKRQYKKAYNINLNASKDAKQFNRYKSILGSKIPDNLANFTNLKYNNIEAWEEIKSLYRSTNYLQEKLDYEYNGEKCFVPSNTKFASKPTALAGRGSDTELRVASRLSEEYGGAASSWSKKAAKVRSAKYTFDVHWYEKEGKQFDAKVKVRKRNEKN